MKKRIFIVLIILGIFVCNIGSINADGEKYSSEEECYEAECSSYTNPTVQDQCRNSCKSKTGGTNGIVIPDGYESYEDYQEDMNNKYSKNEFDIAGGTGFNKNNLATNDNGAQNNQLVKSANKIWGSFLLIIQIVSFAGIIITGIRYMYMSADQRADIKKSMIYLIMGMALVFAASTVINFVINSTSSIIK